MNPTDAFDQAKLKIERADKHIAELNETVDGLSDSNIYRLWVDIDADTGNSLLQFEVSASASNGLALLIGDAIHNLRSSLDVMINRLVASKVAKVPKDAKFPVRATRKELIGAMRDGIIQKTFPDLAKLIIEEIKPFRGGNDSLYALHDLDLADKHMLLIPLIRIGRLTGVNAASDDRRFVIRDGSIAVPESRIFTIFNAKVDNLKIQNYGKPSFVVLFDEGFPMERQPIVPALSQFADLVRGVVVAVESLLS